jgi:hypothetical protein
VKIGWPEHVRFEGEMYTAVWSDSLNRRDVLVNIGVRGKILNGIDGSGLDRSGTGTVLMWPRDSIDVSQGPYCIQRFGGAT